MIQQFLKTTMLAALLLLFVLPAFTQRSKVTIYSTTDSSCMTKVSAYRSYFKEKLYYDAHPTWLIAFNRCRDSSERIYVDGATMFRSFIESTPAGPLREGRIDTLMLIYDLRMENFGGEGNVLGRKGKDLLNYRGADLDQVIQANEMLRTSIKIQGQESLENVMLMCISSGVVLKRNGLLDEDQLIADYIMISGNLVQLEKTRSRWKRTRSKINEMLLKENILSCKALDSYFEPLMETQKNDLAFLETVFASYNPVECESSGIIVTASENMYSLAPGPESAHKLAILFITGNNLEKAAFYLKEALKGENITVDTRAQWYYELAAVSSGLEDYCQAIEYAREAISLKSNMGQAYMLLGDSYIASRRSLGDDFQKRTAYWAAADKYEKASSVDPSLAEEAGKKLSRCLSQYPDKEDIFFSDIREGEAFHVKGCINETTTVRSGK